MAERRKKEKTGDVRPQEIEGRLKRYPPPPEEHAHELKMEKELRRIIKEQTKNKRKKRNTSD